MQWQYWRLIENRFPYANWYSVHHLLVPLSGVAERHELSAAELTELETIVYGWASQHYHQVFENLSSLRSVRNLLHLHLVVLHAYPAPPGR